MMKAPGASPGPFSLSLGHGWPVAQAGPFVAFMAPAIWNIPPGSALSGHQFKG